MKTLLLSLTLLLGILSLKAQQSGPPPPPPSIENRLKHVEELAKSKLNANSNQMAELKKTFKAFFEKMDKLHKDNPPPPPKPEFIQSQKKLEEERDQALQKVLNAQQFLEYKKMLSQLRPPMPPGGPGQGKGPGGPPDQKPRE